MVVSTDGRCWCAAIWTAGRSTTTPGASKRAAISPIRCSTTTPSGRAPSIWPQPRTSSTTSMQVDVESADVKGNRVESATASIANFGEPVLELAVKGKAAGRACSVSCARRRSASATRTRSRTFRSAARATLSSRLTFRSRIRHEACARRYASSSAEANLDDAAFNLHFVDAAGQRAFQPERIRSAPARRSGSVSGRRNSRWRSAAIVADPAHAVEASLSGRFPATTVFADVPELAPALVRFPGDADGR